MADDTLFRIEVFVRSKYLGEVLALLTGKAVEVSPPQLVVNAEQRNGKLRQMTKGRALELFALHIKQRKLGDKTFRATDIRNFLTEIGGSPTSYSWYLRMFTEAGALRKRGEGTASSYRPNMQRIDKIAATAVPQEKQETQHGS